VAKNVDVKEGGLGLKCSCMMHRKTLQMARARELHNESARRRRCIWRCVVVADANVDHVQAKKLDRLPGSLVLFLH
jgi:hypothetical protein